MNPVITIIDTWRNLLVFLILKLFASNIHIIEIIQVDSAASTIAGASKNPSESLLTKVCVQCTLIHNYNTITMMTSLYYG